MARTFRNTAVVRRPSKRHVGWDAALVTTGFTTIAAGAKSVLGILTSAALTEIGPGTIVRTRGMLTFRSDQTGASEGYVGAIGCGFVNVVAGTLGITALPGPVTEALWDGWFVHQFFSGAFIFVSGVGFQEPSSQSIEVDSKAMRKFDQDENMVIMVENGGVTGLDIILQLRFLVKAG